MDKSTETLLCRLLPEEASNLTEMFVQSFQPGQTKLLSIVLRSCDLTLSMKSISEQVLNVSWSLSKRKEAIEKGEAIPTTDESHSAKDAVKLAQETVELGAGK